jgi:hypothetical protein
MRDTVATNWRRLSYQAQTVRTLPRAGENLDRR